MSYEPKPIDTRKIVLPTDISILIEQLAANIHNNWARQRTSEGWQYGEKRDDDRKRHPDLRPYEELPEPEKEYDRITVTETLKSILALGYVIEKKHD